MSSSRWSSSLCAQCSNVEMGALARACGHSPMKLRPQCLSMCVSVCMGVPVLVTCKWMQRKWNEFVRGRKKRSVQQAVSSEQRSTSCEHCKRFAINECLSLCNKKLYTYSYENCGKTSLNCKYDRTWLLDYIIKATLDCNWHLHIIINRHRKFK